MTDQDAEERERTTPTRTRFLPAGMRQGGLAGRSRRTRAASLSGREGAVGVFFLRGKGGRGTTAD